MIAGLTWVHMSIKRFHHSRDVVMLFVSVLTLGCVYIARPPNWYTNGTSNDTVIVKVCDRGRKSMWTTLIGRFQLSTRNRLRGYSINESRFRYIVNPNLDSVKKQHSINESESRFRFGEFCLNPVPLAMWRRRWVLLIINDLRKTSVIYSNKIAPKQTST